MKRPIETLTILVLAATTIGLYSTPAAAACGGLNQRACKVWERVPSCNKGLTELRRPGYCTKPPPKVQNTKCGALNQRPCPVTVRIPSCDKGLVEDFVRNQCVKKSSATSLKALGQQCFNRMKHLSRAMVPVAQCLAQPAVLNTLKVDFRQRDMGGLNRALLQGACAGVIKRTAQVLRQNGMRSMSLGIGGEVGAGIGALSEFFLAIETNLQGRAYLYETIGYKVGWFGGGSVNGIVTASVSQASQLAGDSQSMSVSLKALGGAGGSVGLSYASDKKDPTCTSISAAAGAGVEANAGSLNRVTTLKLK